MLSQVMQDAINEQINNELFASYSWCEHQQFTGCAKWMRIQSDEERSSRAAFARFLARSQRSSDHAANRPTNRRLRVGGVRF